jgi:FtsZ-binding cell division protein ZapB
MTDINTVVACDQKLIEELRAKLKNSVKTILDLNKEIDRLKEELQLSELKYDNLEAAIKREAASRMNRGKSDD